MRGVHLDPAIGKLVHGDLLAGMDSEMLQEVFAERDLPLAATVSVLMAWPCAGLNVRQKYLNHYAEALYLAVQRLVFAVAMKFPARQLLQDAAFAGIW
jgi:hypothetical protein